MDDPLEGHRRDWRSNHGEAAAPGRSAGAIPSSLRPFLTPAGARPPRFPPAVVPLRHLWQGRLQQALPADTFSPRRGVVPPSDLQALASHGSHGKLNRMAESQGEVPLLAPRSASTRSSRWLLLPLLLLPLRGARCFAKGGDGRYWF